MIELTDWFPVHIKPARPGVYERSYNFGVRFAHWDGDKWGGFSSTICDAFSNRDMTTAHPDAAWRGLTTEFSLEYRKVA